MLMLFIFAGVVVVAGGIAFWSMARATRDAEKTYRENIQQFRIYH